MPVTFKVASHAAEPFSTKQPGATTAHEAFKNYCKYSGTEKNYTRLFSSSLDASPELIPTIISRKNGFIDCCLEAYNSHRNLVLRPDDVWLGIITQFCFYVDAHKEELRGYFVGGRAGKKHLTVKHTDISDTAVLSKMMAEKLEGEILDASFREWIVPAFSTTTKTDEAVGAMLMMASLKHYFSYGFMVLCGIPQVTLLGTRDDWQSLRTRLDKLLTIGVSTDEKNASKHPQLHDWHSLLAPIIDNFLFAFDNPEHPANAEFFAHIVRYERYGSGGQSRLNGWLAYFVPFDGSGKWQLTPTKAKSCDWEGESNEPLAKEGAPKFPCPFENMRSHRPVVDVNDIPTGVVSVDVTLTHIDGSEAKAGIEAGMVGYRVVGENDAVQPEPGWWMLEKQEEGEKV